MVASDAAAAAAAAAAALPDETRSKTYIRMFAVFEKEYSSVVPKLQEPQWSPNKGPHYAIMALHWTDGGAQRLH